MVEQTENATSVDGLIADKNVPRTRIQSEIEFPYSDLETAAGLARVLLAKAGNSCDDNELAAWLNQSSTGGTYRARRSSARMFGLIDIVQGKISLTDLGRDLSDSHKERAARVEAFLKPELHQAMYEKCRGHVLPPASALERQIEQLGVPPKQKIRARQVFQKSAIYAGFIDQSSGRFVKPGNGGTPSHRGVESDDPNKGRDQSGNRGGGSGGGSGGSDGNMPQHPLVVGLFQSLPPDGTTWTLDDAVAWLEAAAVNLRLAYKFKGSVTLTPKPPIGGGAES